MPSPHAHAYGGPDYPFGRPKADRASQFMPFAALKGYYELIRTKERVVQPRHESTEEDQVRISSQLSGLNKGDVVRITYYDQDAYVTLQGAVAQVIPEYQTIQVVKTVIRFEDILDIVAPEPVGKETS